jgi:hypothetical protein
MLGTTQLTLARCVKIVLRDGTELGFTDHDRDLVVPLDGSDLYDPVTYRAGFGMIVGDMTLAVGPRGRQHRGQLPDSRADHPANVLSRRFGMADCYLFRRRLDAGRRRSRWS